MNEAQIVNVAFLLVGAVIVGYVPASFLLYWLVKVRGGHGNAQSLMREREISGFFGRRPEEAWNGLGQIGAVIFATLVIALGFLLAYPALQTFFFATAQPSAAFLALQTFSLPLFFAFLGAYLFTLHTTARRFHGGDLNPDAYVAATTRMIVAVIVAAIFSIAFPLQSVTPVSRATIYVLTFVIGIFPENGMEWILSFAGQFIPQMGKSVERNHDLQRLKGLNRWHAIRLNVEGIDNVHNLANADLYELVRATKFTIQQLFDWVDQAVLLTHLKNEQEFDAIQELGVHGLSDFQVVYRNTSVRSALENILGGGEEGTRRLDILYAALQQAPSGDPIRLFWRYKSSYLTDAFEYSSRGRVFAELNEHEEAIKQFNLALDRYPLHPVLMLNRGQSRRALGQQALQEGKNRAAQDQFQEAIGDFSDAIELDPFYREAYIERGRTYLLTEKYQQAVADFDEALHIYKDDAVALSQRAQALQSQGDVAASLQDLERAIKLDAGHLESYIYLANGYRLEGKYPEAEGVLERAIQIDPRAPELYYQRARLYISGPRRRYAAAYSDFERALELGVQNQGEVYTEWGKAYLQEGRYLEAIATLHLAVAANKSYRPAYYLRASAYQAAGQLRQAIADYTTIVERINPDSAEAYVSRGIVYKTLGETANALEDFNRGLRLNPDLPLAYTNRGELYREQGQLAQAREDFKQAIRVQEQLLADATASYEPTAIPYNSMGILAMEEKEWPEAIRYFDQAISLDANYAEAYNNRALARQALGQLTTALADSDRAVQLEEASARLMEQSGVYHYNRGVLRLQLDKVDAAIADFTAAIERNARYVEAYVARAHAYRSAGRLDDAREDLRHVLALAPQHQEARQLLDALAVEEQPQQPDAVEEPVAQPAEEVEAPVGG